MRQMVVPAPASVSHQCKVEATPRLGHRTSEGS